MLLGHFVTIFSNSLRPYAIKIIEIIVAEQFERWNCTPEVPASSPTLTASWIYFGSPEFQSSVTLDNWDLKQLRRRRQQQRQKTIGFMTKTTTLHVHHAFQYISLTSTTAQLRREISQCDVIWRTWTYGDKFSFLYFNMDKALENSTPGKVAYI